MWKALQDRESTASSSRSLKSCISRQLINRVQKERLLKEHSGCVNTCSFTPDGATLITGSDDRDICLWSWQQGKLRLKFASGHTNNIFQAKLLPLASADTLVTCAADGQVRRAILKPDGTQTWRRLASHDGRSHKLSLVPDQPQCFASCGEDGQVLLFDLRQTRRRGGSESGTSSTPAAAVSMVASLKVKELQGNDPLELHSIHHHPTRPWLYVIGGADCVVRVYDMRCTLVPGLPRSARPPTVSELHPSHMPLVTNSWGSPRYHITMAMFARNGQVLATYNDEHIYLFSAEGAAGQQQELATTRPTSGSGSPSKRLYRKRLRSSGAERAEGDGGVTRSDQEEGEPADKAEDDGAAAAAGPSSRREPAIGEGGSGGGQAGPSSRTAREDYVLQVFKGHRNCQTVKGVNLWGEREEYVVSGSDCGHVFVWDRSDAGLLRCMPGDSWVVNCLEPHPSLPLVMATSGIDHDIKIWSPTAPDDEHLETFDDVMAAVASNKQRRQRHEQRQRTREPRIPNWFIRILQRRHAVLAAGQPEEPVDEAQAAHDEEEAEAADRESTRDLLRFVLDTSSPAELRRLVNRVAAASNDGEEASADEGEDDEDEDEDGDDDDDDMPAWVSATALDTDDSGSRQDDGNDDNDDDDGDDSEGPGDDDEEAGGDGDAAAER